MIRFALKQRKGILAVEIGKVSLKLAYFLYSASKLELRDYFLESLDSADNTGQVTNYIRAFIKNNSLSVKEAVLSISDADSVAIKYCLLPALKRNEVLAAAKWQLKDEVPFNLDQAYSDWRVVKEFSDDEGARHQGIIFAFCRKEAVEKYLSCLQQCNLSTAAIVTSAFSYIDVLKGIAENKQLSSEIVLGLERLDSTLSLYIDKKLHFTRYLPISVDSFTRSLISTLASDRGKVELTLREAEEIRDNIGIPENEKVFIRDNLQASQIISLLRPVLESLVREIKHSIAYFTATLGEPIPQVIYLAGLGANLKNLDTCLGKELGLKVMKLPFPKIFDSSRIDSVRLSKDQSQIVGCVGTILSAARGINLLPHGSRIDWIKHVWVKRLKPVISVIGILIVFWMLISVLMLAVYNYRLKKAKDYFRDKKTLVAFFEKMRLRKEIFFEVFLERVPVDALLNFISQFIPDGLRLDGLELDQYRGELILQGQARQAQDLEVFLRKLEASGFLSLGQLSKTGTTGSSFKIKCKLKY